MNKYQYISNFFLKKETKILKFKLIHLLVILFLISENNHLLETNIISIKRYL